jgi:hypothetical protein
VTALLVKAGALRLDDWALLGRALFTLARVRVALWLVPWRRLLPALHTTRRVGRFQPRRLEWAIRIASRAVPGATCLTQAMALHELFARFGYPSIVQVGVRRGERDFSAHAWVDYQGQSFLSSPAEVARYARFFTWPDSPLG